MSGKSGASSSLTSGVRTIVLGSRQMEMDPLLMQRLHVLCAQLNVELLQLQLEFQSITPPSTTVVVSASSPSATILQ